MLDEVLATLGDAGFVATLLVSLGSAATVLLAMMPLLARDDTARRIKAVTTERERIRLRERERLTANTQQKQQRSLRYRSGGVTKQLVDGLSLDSWLNTNTAKMKLAQAGFRGQGPENAFLAYRLASPILFLIAGVVYLFFIAHLQWSFMVKCGASMACAYVGIKAPELFLSNKIAKRQKEMGRAYPNMVDLMIICVESGMSIEHGEHGAGGGDVPAGGGDELSGKPAHRVREFLQPHGSRRHQAALHGADPVREIWHAARRRSARAGAGKPRSASYGGREESRVAAARADGADDHLLPAGPVLRDSDARRHHDQPLDVRA
jgi:hypothetical protein